MDNKFLSGFIAVAIIVLAGVIAFKNVTVKVELPSVYGGGSAASNQNSEPQYFQGGSTSRVETFVSTTTIACAIQNRTNATTTFRARWMSTAATTTTTVIGIATSTNVNRFSTTTAVATVTLGANALGAGSYNGATNQNIIGPGEWVTFGYGAGTTLPSVAQNQVGFCSVSFDNIK